MPLSTIRLYKERLRDVLQRMRMRMMTEPARMTYQAQLRKQVFTTIMQEYRWGETHLSGGGSTIK